MRRPTRPCTLASLLVPLLASYASAQSPAADLARLLQQRVLHQQVILQNFNAESEVHALASAGGILLKPAFERSFSLISFQKVSVDGQRVILTGTKQYVLRSKGQVARSAETEPVRLEILVDPGTTHASLAQAADSIFFPDVRAALEAVPVGARDFVPAHADPSAGRSSPPTCDCTEGSLACPPSANAQGWKRPELIHQQDPEMPPGSPQGSTVSTTSAIQVDIKGEVASVWLLRAPSVAFAEATFASARRYSLQASNVPREPSGDIRRNGSALLAVLGAQAGST